MLEQGCWKRRVTLRAALGALGLSLALSAVPARAQEPILTPPETPGPFGAPGPYEIVEENNIGLGFATGGFDDTSLCEIAVPNLTNGKATEEQHKTFIKYPANLNPRLHTIIRPKVLEAGKKYPVVIWGNGVCAAPIYYRRLLNHLASYGFVVVTANSRQISSSDMLRSLGAITQLNNQRTSPYYQKLDVTHVGMAGHAQGGAGAMIAAADPRVKAAVSISSGLMGEPLKPALFLTGEKDVIVPYEDVKDAYDVTEASAVYVLSRQADYVSPILEPFLFQPSVLAFFLDELTGDAKAAAFLRGPNCGLCSDPNYHVESKVFTFP